MMSLFLELRNHTFPCCFLFSLISRTVREETAAYLSAYLNSFLWFPFEEKGGHEVVETGAIEGLDQASGSLGWWTLHPT